MRTRGSEQKGLLLLRGEAPKPAASFITGEKLTREENVDETYKSELPSIYKFLARNIHFLLFA